VDLLAAIATRAGLTHEQVMAADPAILGAHGVVVAGG
jgi:hypothetical protein